MLGRNISRHFETTGAAKGTVKGAVKGVVRGEESVDVAWKYYQKRLNFRYEM